MNLIQKIVIPNYPDELLMANSMRPKYYIAEWSVAKGEKNIPKSFLNEEKYYFSDKGILMNRSTGLPQLKNSKSVGKPRMWKVNFQDIWNQSITRMARAIRTEKLKEIFRSYIEQFNIITEFPIEVSIILYNTGFKIDTSNKGVIYIKIIEDLLQELKKIPNDSINYVNCSGRTKCILVENKEEIRMEIYINKSNSNSYD